MLLYLGDEPHAGIRAHVHGGQDRYDDKEPGGRAGRVHSLDHPVLLPQKKKQQALCLVKLFYPGVQQLKQRLLLETIGGYSCLESAFEKLMLPLHFQVTSF